MMRTYRRIPLMVPVTLHSRFGTLRLTETLATAERIAKDKDAMARINEGWDVNVMSGAGTPMRFYRGGVKVANV